jgi:biopolymer transport protein ExbD
MSWAVRHEGSPRHVEGLTTAEVIEGLEAGQWEPTDEVMGPGDANWTVLEDHPMFADTAQDLDLAPPRHYEDETRLDMNPLIDVCLVLLIFFILTTSYAALQRFLDSPRMSPQKVEGPPVYTPEQLKEFTIKVVARRENGEPVIRVENQLVQPAELVPALRRWVKQQRKNILWLDIANDVTYGTEIRIRDAAKGAGIEKILVQVEKPEP